MLFFLCVFVFVFVFNSAPTVCLGPWPLIVTLCVALCACTVASVGRTPFCTYIAPGGSGVPASCIGVRACDL